MGLWTGTLLIAQWIYDKLDNMHSKNCQNNQSLLPGISLGGIVIQGNTLEYLL